MPKQSTEKKSNPFKLLVEHVAEYYESYETPTVHFTIKDFIHADVKIITSKLHTTDGVEIIVYVTQSQKDQYNEHKEDEGDLTFYHQKGLMFKIFKTYFDILSGHTFKKV